MFIVVIVFDFVVGLGRGVAGQVDVLDQDTLDRRVRRSGKVVHQSVVPAGRCPY